MEKSNEDKILAGLAHLGVVFGWPGLIAALIIYLVCKDRSLFIRANVKQALGYQVCVLILLQILILIFGGGALLGILTSQSVTPGIISVGVVRVIGLAFALLGIWGAFRTFVGENFRYPLIGDFIDRL